MKTIIRPVKVNRPHPFSIEVKKKSTKKCQPYFDEDNKISRSMNLNQNFSKRELESRKIHRKIMLTPQKNAKDRPDKFTFCHKDSDEFWESIGGNLTSLQISSTRNTSDNIQSQYDTMFSPKKSNEPLQASIKNRKKDKLFCDNDHKFYSTTTVFVMKKNQMGNISEHRVKKIGEKRINSMYSPQKNPQYVKKNSFRTKPALKNTVLRMKEESFCSDLSISPMKQKIIAKNYESKGENLHEQKIDAWNFNFQEDDLGLIQKSEEIKQ